MPDDQPTKNESNIIVLSKFTQALLDTFKTAKKRVRPDDISALSVSQTVSFFALVYERVRNAVEYREDHLILRAAIERILRRRFSLNPDGHSEAENLLRELLWARYFDNGVLGAEDNVVIQNLINKYVLLRRQLVVGRDNEIRIFLDQFLMDLLTCEVEETLQPESATIQSNLSSFIFQILRRKIKIEGLKEDQKDAYSLVAIEKVFGKSDRSYLRYRLFTTFYKTLHDYSEKELQNLGAKLPAIFKKIDDMVTNPYVDNLAKFTRKQLPPFLILFALIKNKPDEVQTILTNRERLWTEIDQTCRDKYQQLGVRVRTLAVRSFIYILLTKMIFAIILEVPISIYVYGEVNRNAIIINSVFPPILMIAILGFFKVPGEENTRKIYQRIIDIIDDDKSFETRVAFMPKKSSPKRPLLIFGFTVFYSLTFLVTLSLIYEFLSNLGFNLVSQVIFIFFVSVVSFFSYRIRQVTKELRLEEKASILAPIGDFFFMPMLSLGKFFSSGIAKLNFFIFIFDFIIEAPFKLIFEVVEEWISFVRKRKEEII
ncbi:hypothetical protein CO165_00540 [Candidatus Roizmanbacteria bacterium CG_4_9_14_3_um_filter_33_18]|uniref:Uncharacterized protein n=2 Tax=Candidatus Roizmaniibacteriota TaxID=1752723 RepID=A0A2M7XZ69_9BACT|nr:MAG: hypothetical protein COW97_03365 [Candidatus Roizmanbacteria bacterium CG22_combo_CG10-13_8_21_14_all_34_12]PJA56007.1 MAG: hypothetical protein CO165_00540 [Candidatus Roizmanbacteria bacterium CG_4_9_14_3_um_filter_33_18]